MGVSADITNNPAQGPNQAEHRQAPQTNTAEAFGGLTFVDPTNGRNDETVYAQAQPSRVLKDPVSYGNKKSPNYDPANDYKVAQEKFNASMEQTFWRAIPRNPEDYRLTRPSRASQRVMDEIFSEGGLNAERIAKIINQDDISRYEKALASPKGQEEAVRLYGADAKGKVFSQVALMALEKDSVIDDATKKYLKERLEKGFSPKKTAEFLATVVEAPNREKMIAVALMGLSKDKLGAVENEYLYNRKWSSDYANKARENIDKENVSGVVDSEKIDKIVAKIKEGPSWYNFGTPDELEKLSIPEYMEVARRLEKDNPSEAKNSFASLSSDVEKGISSLQASGRLIEVPLKQYTWAEIAGFRTKFGPEDKYDENFERLLLERLMKRPEWANPFRGDPLSQSQVDMAVKYYQERYAAAKEFGLNPDLIAAVSLVECGYSEDVILGQRLSVASAKGAMQVISTTAEDMGYSFEQLSEAKYGYLAGSEYLAAMLEQFRDLEDALAAYNAGPGRVEKLGGFENVRITETQNYVPWVAHAFAAMCEERQKLRRELASKS